MISRRFSTRTIGIIEKELRFSAHNYHPLPVALSRGEGAHLFDVDGLKYLDFLSSYSAVNQGHCHPKITEAMVKQAGALSLSSRAFYNDKLGEFSEFVTGMFGQEMVLAMNTGAEAVETAVKMARRWAYRVKRVPMNRALIVSAADSFHGRTQTAMAMSTDPSMTADFGPLLPGILKVRYNDTGHLGEIFDRYGRDIAAFLVEPIQGEAGVVVPDDGYLREVHDLCRKHNILLIDDEIQTGIARTGKMICAEYDQVKPDILILGKAVSGGAYPVSLVLSSREIMLQIRPGEHGSTFGGNPLACAVARAALEVVTEENLVEKAFRHGVKFRQELASIQSQAPWLKHVRGRGLLNAIVLDHDILKETTGNTAWELCLLMKDRGLLAKPTRDNVIRLAPPLVISDADLERSLDIIRGSVLDLPIIPKNKIPNPEMRVTNPHPG